MAKYTQQDLGRLGQEGYVVLKDKKGMLGKTPYEQVKIVKTYNDELIKVIKEKQDGTSMIQFAKDNRIDTVDSSEIVTKEHPLTDWD